MTMRRCDDGSYDPMPRFPSDLRHVSGGRTVGWVETCRLARTMGRAVTPKVLPRGRGRWVSHRSEPANRSFGFSEFNLTPDPTQMFNASVSPDRGALRDRHERGSRCGGRGLRSRRMCMTRTVKSCGPDALVAGVFSHCAMRVVKTVTTKPSLAGESTK